MSSYFNNTVRNACVVFQAGQTSLLFICLVKQIYDPSDSYDCKDSTIALKHEDSSGGKVTTTSTKPAVKGTEIRKVITSKNNDKYKLRKDFELNIVVVFRGTGKSFWSSLLKTKVHVSIRE